MPTPDWVANAKRPPRKPREPMNFSMSSFLWTTLLCTFGALFLFT